jgi:hypothetical protein
LRDKFSVYQERGVKNREWGGNFSFSIVLLLSFMFAPVLTRAVEEDSFKASTELQLQLTSVPEAKARLIQSFVFPFLQGSNPLTEGNNLAAAVSADVTPVSVFGTGEITLTPAAFFLLSGGGKAGSGWDIPLGKGIGINAPEDENAPRPRKAKVYGNAFDGLIWGFWGAATVQFDLGAVIPGDWTHVLFRTRQEFRYAAYTRAGPGESWVDENDEGENQNGWVYYASYVLGYKMPQSLAPATAAFMAELEKPLYNTPGGDYWGENLGRWTFSGLLDFTITPRLGAVLAVQMQTRINHSFDNNSYYYRDLELRKEGQRRLHFYRAAAIITYKIK